jgi:hypothetical protein
MNLLTNLTETIRSAAKVNRSLMVPPVAILWTDADRIWESAIPQLAKQLSELFVLGDYAPADRQGPSIWLKCAVAGKLGTQLSSWTCADSVLARHQPCRPSRYRNLPARAAAPRRAPVPRCVLEPSKRQRLDRQCIPVCKKRRGLGLDVAQDSATQEALKRVLAAGMLLDRQVEDLQGKQINAAWLDALLAPNPTRDVLAWLNDPAATQSKWAGARWAIFTSRCVKDFGFNPETDGALTAARKAGGAPGPLGQRVGAVLRVLRQL